MDELNRIALLQENRVAINTNEAACQLGRKPQTLRKWACREVLPSLAF
jgi:hypothetical protein